MLVEKIAPDLLAETDNFGNTALHLAANVGHVEDARILVGKDPELLNRENKDRLLPIQLAARREPANARSMTSYLFKAGKVDDNHSKLLKGAAGAGVDLALELLEFNEKLAWEKGDISPLEQMASDPEEENNSPLEQMANDPGGFKSGIRLSSWQSLIYLYSYVPTKRNGMTEYSPSEVYKTVRNLLAKVLVQNMDIPALKLKHHHALRLVQSLCSTIKTMGEPQTKLGKPLLLGAQNGIEEIVHEILESLPTAITYTNDKNRSIFHVAVMYRRENILKMAHEKNKQRKGTKRL
ncbi:unnamed protein product [Fraxinus pennsylvanica]|uniref:Uncharacterized protein n=1 Tax=Fraxinus pennsylvanica TaxID=56036 RepID=A0AAD1ZCA3_9LAMI|nr:unnamed protein product [Fraxinus pennsylvanica]